MQIKIAILFVLITVSVAGWGIYVFQKLTTTETTMAEIQRAFPANSYQLFLNSNKLTLYRLKPEPQTDGEKFRDFTVLGKTEIDTVPHQKELKAAFVTEMAAAKSAGCFNPSHGLRAVADDGKTVDVVVSFECGKFTVYSGDAQSEGGIKAEHLEAPFNQILNNAGIETSK
jgi:hypothetical protein